MTLKFPELGSNVTVNSSTTSGGGFPNELYTLWGASSNLPNSRYLEAGANITFVNDGAKITVVGGSSGSGAPISASYITVNTEASLTGSRRIAAGTGISLVDNTTTIDVAVNNTLLGAKFITFGSEAILTNERTLGVAGGLTIQDTGIAITVSASDLQPLDSTLTSLASFNTNGLLTQTSPDTFAGRTIVGTANEIDITNGNGVSGNPVVALATGIDPTKLADGSVSATEFQYLDGVTSSIQTQLNNKQAGDATLTSLASYNTNGLLTQTAADTFTGRTIAGTTNRISVTNGDGVSGNPTLDIGSDVVTLAGNQVLTNKTISFSQITGTVPISQGGTGSTTSPGNGKLLIGKTDGSYAVANLTAGANVTITNSDGGITISATATGSGSSSGTVTDFTAGDLSPLFTTDVTNSTTTPNLTFTLTPVACSKGYFGPENGVDADPTFRHQVVTDLPSSEAIGQVFIGNISNSWTRSTLTQGSNISIVNGDGSITIAATGLQASDPTLTALASYNTDGLLTQTSADTFTGRTITGTSNEITVTNGNGVSGNPTLSLASGIDPSKLADGSVTATEFQYINTLSSNAQTQLDSKAANSEAFVTIGNTTGLSGERRLEVAGGLTIQDSGANSAVTISGSSLQPLDSTLTSLAAFNTDGLLTQTSADTFTGRTITGTANEITVTNGNGVSGNPTLSLPTGIDPAKLADGSVSATEFQYLNGVTSGLQGQLDAKASNAESYITIGNTSGLSNERRIEVAGGLTIQDNGPNSSVVISASGVTGTGITSYTTGDILYASGASALSKLGIGSSGQVLSVSGGLPAWSTPTGQGQELNGYRLSCDATDPEPSSDQLGASTIYAIPYKHDKIALFNGTTWDVLTPGIHSIAVPASQYFRIYNFYDYNNSGTATPELDAWDSGGQSTATISGATAANPCVLTTSAAHGWSVGDIIGIRAGTGTGTGWTDTKMGLDQKIFYISAVTSTTLTLEGCNTTGLVFTIFTGATAYKIPASATTGQTRQNGVLSKTGALTRRFLGTFMTNGAGTVDDAVKARCLSNAENQVKARLYAEDVTASVTAPSTVVFTPYNTSLELGTTRFIFISALAQSLPLRATTNSNTSGSGWGLSIDRCPPATQGTMQALLWHFATAGYYGYTSGIADDYRCTPGLHFTQILLHAIGQTTFGRNCNGAGVSNICLETNLSGEIKR